jgi:hypothetical protein
MLVPLMSHPLKQFQLFDSVRALPGEQIQPLSFEDGGEAVDRKIDSTEFHS